MKKLFIIFLVCVFFSSFASSIDLYDTNSGRSVFNAYDQSALFDEPPPTNALPPDGTSDGEVDNTAYSSRLSSSNDNDYSMSIPDNAESYIYFNATVVDYTLAAYLNWTIEIAPGWDGTTAKGNTSFYMWNASGSTWYECTTQIPGATTPTDQIKSCFLSTGIQDFFDANGRTYFMVYNTDPNDVDGLGGQTTIDYIKLEVSVPRTAVVSPANATFTNNPLVNITCNGSDTSLANLTLNIYNSSNALIITNTSSVSGSSNQSSFLNTLTTGTYKYSCTLGLSPSGYAYSANNTITIDVTNPGLLPLTPTNGSTVTTSTTINFSANVSDNIQLGNATLSVYNSTGLYNRTIWTTFAGLLQTIYQALVVPDGTYNWNWVVYDQAGNVNSTVNFTIEQEGNPPIININYPLATNYTVIPTTFNHTASDKNLQSCWYSINGGITNLSTTCNTNISLVATQGSQTWIIYANDSAGNTGNKNVTFFVDSIKPTIDFVSPTDTNNTFLNRPYILGNVTSVDTNLKNITLDLYNTSGLVNTTSTTTSPNYQNITVVDGRYWLNATAYDTLSNSNSTQTKNYTVDTTFPLVSYNSGTLANNTNVSQSNVYINLTITEINHANTTFRIWNSSWSNTTTLSGAITSINFTSLADGTYYYNATVTDLASNSNSTQNRIITLDILAPTVQLLSPSDDYFSNNSANNFTVNLTDDTTKLVNTTLNIYNSSGSLINQTTTIISGLATSVVGTVVSLVDGIYNWFYEAFDFAGNRGIVSNNTLTIDTTKPGINILYPVNGTQYFSETFSINYTISELYPSACWYSLNGGANQILSGCNNISSLTAIQGWNNLTVYANDTVNNLNYTTISFYIDSVYPLVSYISQTINNNSYLTHNNIWANVSITDALPNNVTIYLYNATSLVNSSSLNITTVNNHFANFTNLPDSRYYFNATGCDLALCTNLVTRIAVVDTTNPLISLVASTENNNTAFKRNWIFVNVSLTETNFANITFRLYNTTGLVNSTNYSTAVTNINFTGLSDNVYYYNVTVFDLSGRSNTTETRLIYLDNVAPTVNIITPTATTYKDTYTYNLNVTTSSVSPIHTYWYNINDSATNITFTPNTTITPITGGVKLLTVWINDSAGNVNSSNVTYNLQFTPKINDIKTITGPTRGLVAYYNFDENRTDNKIIDFFNIYNATQVNATFNASGKILGSYDFINFMGKFAKVTTPINENVLNLSNSSFTWCAWFYNKGDMTNSTGSRLSQHIVTTYPGSSPQVTLQFDYVNNRTQITTRNSSTVITTSSATGSTPRNQWNYVCMVVDRSEGPVGMQRIFINGISQSNWNNSIATGRISNQNITIGGPSATGETVSTYFNGSIDEVKIYNTSLTASEINQLYQVTFPATTQRNSLTDGLVGYWKFDENSSIQKDSANGLYNATGNSNLTFNPSGKIGGAYEFNANDAYTLTDINLTNFTLVAWVYKKGNDTTADSTGVIWKNTEWGMRVTKNNILECYSNNGTAWDDLSTDTQILDNTWVLLSCAYNGSGMSAYIDGSLKKSEVQPRPKADNSINVEIGRQDGSRGWNGTLDEVRIYNRSLSASEVSQLYSVTNPTFQEYPNVTINTTITDEDTPQGSLYYSWFVDSVSVLTGFAQNVFSWVFTGRTNQVDLFVNDTQNYTVRQTWNISTTFINPTINYTTNTPTNNTYRNVNNFLVNFTGTELNINSTWVNFNNTNYTASCTGTSPYLCSYNFTSISDGVYNYTAYINDSVGNRNNTETRLITIDTTKPVIAFVSPTENTGVNKSQNWIYLNSSVTETNEANITFNLYNITGLVNSTTYTNSQRTINFTNIPNGKYWYNITVMDLAGNLNSTETRVITLDTISPNATLNTPVNNTFTTNLNQNFTVNVSDNTTGSGIQNVTLNIYNTTGLYNQTTVTSSNIFTNTIGIVVSLVDGVYRWFYSLVDFAGNTYTTPQNNTITADTTPPVLSYVSPTDDDDAIRLRPWIAVNVSITDLTNITQVTFNLYNYSGYIFNSTTYNSDTRFINWTGIQPGRYYYNVTVKDYLNNTASLLPRSIIIDLPYLIENFRLDEINTNNVTLRYEPNDSIEWVSVSAIPADGGATYNTGTLFYENGTITSSQINNITVFSDKIIMPTLLENTLYNLSIQYGRISTGSIYGPFNFQFRTYSGWYPELSNWTYRRLITIDNSSVVSDTNTGVLNITLTKDNFYNYDVGYARLDFQDMNYSNGNDLRFVDFYNTEILEYDIISFNVQNNGTETSQIIPNEISYTGSFDNSTLCHDGVYNTKCVATTSGTQYYNYTVPTNATSALINIDDGDYTYYYVDVPTACFNVGGKVQLRTVMENGVGQNSSCWNGASWEDVGYYQSTSDNYFESEVLWRYPATINMLVKPLRVVDDGIYMSEGLDSNYAQKLWMYYGYSGASANETTVSYSTVTDQYTLGDREGFILTQPIILSVNENPINTTAININASINFVTNNTLEYATNPYFLDKNVTSFNGTAFPSFNLTSLNPNLTYYYRLTASVSAGSDSETGDFILGTPYSVASGYINSSSYDEDRPNQNITICGVLSNMNGNTQVNISIQYWNELSTTFNETSKVVKTGVGSECWNISVDYGRTYSYRLKMVGTNTGYSDAFTNEFMAIQDFFVGSYIDDDLDYRQREYCLTQPVNLSASNRGTCYNQTGMREGSYQEENWVWVESGISHGALTLHWYNSTTWNTYTMNKDLDSAMYYYKLENLPQGWQTMYMTNSTGFVVLNWTKPGLNKNISNDLRHDVQKYVYFNKPKEAINYSIAYMDYEPLKYGATGSEYCGSKTGNINVCNVLTWGTGGYGTPFDRGELFAGGAWNGGQTDTGILQSNPTNRSIMADLVNERFSSFAYDGNTGRVNQSGRGCFTFTNYWWQMNYVPNNNITNYYVRFWDNDETWSVQNSRWEDTELGSFFLGSSYGYSCIKIFNDTDGSWNGYQEGCLSGTEQPATSYTNVLNNTNKDIYGFEVGQTQRLFATYKDGFNVDTSNDKVYDLSFTLRGLWSNQLINKHQQGFFIFNLPDNATLELMDSDSDTINDKEELFVYYTNPFMADTDMGGRNDGEELAMGLNPNIYEDDTEIELLTPVNNTATPVTTQNFTANLTTPNGATNLTLTINNQTGLYNQTTIELNQSIVQQIIGIPVVLVDGIYNWFYSLFSVAGNQYTSENNTLTIDTNIPFVELIYPVNGSIINNNTIDFTCNITTGISGGENVTLYVWNSTGLVLTNSTNLSGLTLETAIFTNTLADGGYNYSCLAYNTVGNGAWALSNSSFNLDGTKPLISYVANTDVSGSHKPVKTIDINISVTEANIVSIITRIYNNLGIELASYTTTNPNQEYSLNLVFEGLYYFNTTVTDIAGNTNSTETRNVTLDTTFPLVQLVSPANGTITGATSNFLAIANDTNLAYATLNIFNSTGLVNATNTSLSGTSQLISTNVTLTDGFYTWFYSIYDLAGNVNNSENVSLEVDTLPPVLSFVSPTNSAGSHLSLNYIVANVSATDPNLNNITLKLYNSGWTLLDSVSSTSIATTTSSLYNNFSSLSNGLYYVNATSCDDFGACDTISRNFTLDTILPNVQITYPLTGTYNYTFSTLNYTYSDTNPVTCKYSTNNGVTNTTIANCLNVTGLTTPDGNNSWTVWVTDGAGNINMSRSYIFVDTVIPNAVVTNPSGGSGGGTVYHNNSNQNFTAGVHDYDNSTRLCYQESANTSNQTGIDGNCNLNYSGSYDTHISSTFLTIKNTYDGDFSSFSGVTNAGTSNYLYINYSKPVGSVMADWRVKGNIDTNLSIPSDCFSQPKLQLYWEINSLDFVGGKCWNGSSWKSVGNGISFQFYEEGIYWSIPINSTINASGLANVTLNVTNNQTGAEVNITRWSFVNMWESVVSVVVGLVDGVYDFVFNVVDQAGNIFTTDEQTITVDTTNPALNLIYPQGVDRLMAPGSYTINVNYTISDTNLNTCWYVLNNDSAVTLPGCGNTTLTIDNNATSNTITVYANDSAGNTVSDTNIWDILFLNNISYINRTISGAMTPFNINLSYPTSFFGIAVNLNYSGTLYSMTSADSSYTKMYTLTVPAPIVDAVTNETFSFNIVLSNSTGTFTFKTGSYNQTVEPFLIDNCTLYNNTILSMTMIDEETLQGINGTILFNGNIYTAGHGLLVNTYNTTFNYIGSPARICVANLTSEYSLEYIIQHYGSQTTVNPSVITTSNTTGNSTDSSSTSNTQTGQGVYPYFKKFRTIQNMTLSSNTTTSNLTLYNLIQGTGGQTFLVRVTGNYLATGGNNNLLVEAQKRYIPQDTFNLVESAATNPDGEMALHLVPSTEVYNFVVSSMGQILGTFNNYQVRCSNIQAQQCEVILNLVQSTATLPDFTNTENVGWTYIYDNETRQLYLTFNSNDGSAHTINWMVYANDGERTVIENITSYGTSGTLIGNIPVLYTNSSVDTTLVVDGKFLSRNSFILGEDPDFKGVQLYIELLMFSTLVLLFIAHPAMIIIGGFLGLLASVALLFLGTGGFTMGTVVIYYIIAGIIIIWQIGRKM